MSSPVQVKTDEDWQDLMESILKNMRPQNPKQSKQQIDNAAKNLLI